MISVRSQETLVDQRIAALSTEGLSQFINTNFCVFEKLRGKKRSVVGQVVERLLQRTQISDVI